jgi:hypothetical protein
MSEKPKVEARARVKATLMAVLPDVWGTEAKAQQVYDQARQSAKNHLLNATVGMQSSHPNAIRGWSVADIEVEAVFLPEGNSEALQFPKSAAHNAGNEESEKIVEMVVVTSLAHLDHVIEERLPPGTDDALRSQLRRAFESLFLEGATNVPAVFVR